MSEPAWIIRVIWRRLGLSGCSGAIRPMWPRRATERRILCWRLSASPSAAASVRHARPHLARGPWLGVVTPLRTCGSAGGSVAKGMKKISYGGYRFPPEIIQQAIWLYIRFTLSSRDVEGLLAKRGILAS